MDSMNKHYSIHIANEIEMQLLGTKLAHALQAQGIIYLKGLLGAGKTTLTRSILRTLGISGTIRSPTYTLVETYELPTKNNEAVVETQSDLLKYAYHLDLYRIKDPLELVEIGIRDYLDDSLSLMIIEWPEIAEAVIPNPDLMIHIQFEGLGRYIDCQAKSQHGNQVIHRLISS